METILKQIKQILITATLALCITSAIAQKRVVNTVAEKHNPRLSAQLKEFYHLTSEANAVFIFPKEFKEIKAPDNEDFSFDYAMELPGKGFEIWLQVKSEKENWASYVRAQALNNQNIQLANPDSLYATIGAAHAIAFTGDRNYLVRSIPPEYLAPYHADVGKSYLLTLLDLPDTKRYKYALMFTLQKFHTGTILAICFTNEKGPEFFKNINKVSNCFKFKP
jgi:hypothetical protein